MGQNRRCRGSGLGLMVSLRPDCRQRPNGIPCGSCRTAITPPSGRVGGGIRTFVPSHSAFCAQAATSSTEVKSCTELGACGRAGQTPPWIPSSEGSSKDSSAPIRSRRSPARPRDWWDFRCLPVLVFPVHTQEVRDSSPCAPTIVTITFGLHWPIANAARARE